MIDASNTVILNGTGIIMKPGATEDDPPVTLSGFHANTVESVMAAHPELEARRVTPAKPMFLWAGDSTQNPDTVCLRWDDQATMYEELGPGMAPQTEPLS